MKDIKINSTGLIAVLFWLCTNGDFDEMIKHLEKHKDDISKEEYDKILDKLNEIKELSKRIGDKI